MCIFKLITNSEKQGNAIECDIKINMCLNTYVHKKIILRK